MKLTTKNKIQYFKDCTHEWIKYFGLFEWEVHFDIETNEGVRATCYYDAQGRIATMCYQNKWIKEVKTKEEINRVTFHETAELFLYFVYDPIKKHSNHDEAQEAVHRVIRFLENKILGQKT